MIWELGSAVKYLLLPPLLFGWLLVYGLVMFRRKPRSARWAIGSGITLLYVCATPYFANYLMDRVVERVQPQAGAAPQAVVILAGGRRLEFDEAGGVKQARLGPATSERVFEGMRIAREKKLPILVTSGKPDGFDPAEAIVMRDVMVREFGVTPRWVEAESRNTVENAQFSAPLLKRSGISSVILVTHGYHMRRARYLFEQAGLRVTPAPVDPRSEEPFVLSHFIRSFVANTGALSETFLACNELGGMAYAWVLTNLAAPATPSAAAGN